MILLRAIRDRATTPPVGAGNHFLAPNGDIFTAPNGDRFTF